MTPVNTYTLDDILALRPCDPDRRRALFADARTLTAREALERGATVQDLLWVAGKMGRKAGCVRFAAANLDTKALFRAIFEGPTS